MTLPTSLFDYDLPAARIAQTPAARREDSRLLVVHRATQQLEHRRFADLPEYLRPGDTLLRNNAAVLPARLAGVRPTGGAVECLLLRPEQVVEGREVWWCLLRPGKKLPVGAVFSVGGTAPGETLPGGAWPGMMLACVATVLAKQDDGVAQVSFAPAAGDSVVALANRLGTVPLPPYIEREGTEAERAQDLERYQTVYADRSRQVAVAAPTAGLHFTPTLLAQVQAAGIGLAEITLHVGLGTFKPIQADTVEAHDIHRELYELPPATRRVLAAPTGRRIAVGTTSVRAIEDYLARSGGGVDGTGVGGAGMGTVTGMSAGASTDTLLQPWVAEAAIYIYPPRRFQGVDALITNFHQPCSTLLCLVSAFLTPGSVAGIDWLREIYAEAVRREYRFLSYGDAMLIV